MNVLNFASRHRTKILGMAQVSCGAIMTQLAFLQPTIKPITFGLSMMALGVSTAVLGFINTNIVNSQIAQAVDKAINTP